MQFKENHFKILMNNNLFKEITIIIILYEEKINLVLSCLENIKDFKIIIIDNAGNKNLKKKIEEKFKIYKYILNSKNVGYSKAANQAIQLCSSEYILAIDADGVMYVDDINVLFESYKKYKDCLIVSPTCYDNKSRLTYTGVCLPEKKIEAKIINLEGDICVDTIVTAAYLFKKKDFIEIGLFDENFFLYFSEFDICRRAIDRKKSIIQVFNSKAQHVHGQIKVQNFLKKIFIRNFHFTFDELYYFYKINKHHDIFNKLKKKIPNYLFKFLFNLILLKLSKSLYYFSKTLAYFKFKKFLYKIDY